MHIFYIEAEEEKKMKVLDYRILYIQWFLTMCMNKHTLDTYVIIVLTDTFNQPFTYSIWMTGRTTTSICCYWLISSTYHWPTTV